MNEIEAYETQIGVLARENERLRGLTDTGPGWRRAFAAREEALEAEIERLRDKYDECWADWNETRNRLRRIEEAGRALTAINLPENWRLDGHAAASYVAAAYKPWAKLAAALCEEEKE